MINSYRFKKAIQTAITNLLLHFNGANGSTTITDDSNGDNSPHTVIANGNAQLKTTEKTINPYSTTISTAAHPPWDDEIGVALFNTDAKYIMVSNNGGKLNMGTNDCTIEFMFMDAGTGDPYPSIVTNSPSSWTNGCFGVHYNNSGHSQRFTIHWNGEGDIPISSTNTFATASWHYVKVTRSGNTLSLYVNNNLEGTATVTSPINLELGSGFAIGTGIWDGGNGHIKGYVCDVRISNIIRPNSAKTGPFTADENTLLLMPLTGPNNSTVFPDYSLIDPFGTVSGSVYHGGSGDYISSAANDDYNWGTGDGTLDFWFKDDGTTNSYPCLAGNAGVSGWGAGCFGIRYNNTGHSQKVIIAWNDEGDPVIASVNTFPTAIWHHVAMMVINGYLYLCVNGKCEGAAKVTTALNLGYGGFRSGGGTWDGAGSYFKGWLDEMRLIKGEAKFLKTIPIPTAEYASNANTSLLLHCNGADGSTSFVDSSGNANAITANGNAQIDTAQKKFGTGSALFDGSGDYLSCAGGALYAVGTADYTIDLMIYVPSAISGTQCLYATTTAGGVACTITSTQIRIGKSRLSVDLAVDAAVPVGQWSHICIARNNGIEMIWLNGELKGAKKTNINYSSTGNLNIGIDGDSSSIPFTGQIDEFRFLKGSADGRGEYTIPTQEYNIGG